MKATASVFLLVLAIGCSGSEYDEPPFETIEIFRGEGFGFCPAPGEILSGQIARTADGSYVMTYSIAVEAPAGTASEDCLDQFSDQCLASEQREPLTLSDRQRAELFAAIEAVPAKDCDQDRDLACDPCVVTSVTVDGHDASGFCCGDVNQGFADRFRDLVREIDGLAQ